MSRSHGEKKKNRKYQWITVIWDLVEKKNQQNELKITVVNGYLR